MDTERPTSVPPSATATPDPFAACQHDPANLPPLQSGTTFHTCGAQIMNADGHPVRITGVSWFGMETGTYAPHGLWTRNWKAMLDQIAAMGFNTVRIPFSNDALTPGRMPQNINYAVNPDLAGKTSLQLLDMLVQGAGERGLKVILDRHRPTSAAQSDLWYTDDVPEERWIADWVMLAQRYENQAALLGVDLHNEPRGPATWGSDDVSTDWRLAAERAGNAILAVNPYVLIFVQGIERSGDDWYWWGGNFLDARTAPVQLAVPGRVVYSPHDYGPDVYAQPWFSAADFPNNLPGIWDAHWGYLATDQAAPVVLGEFGGAVSDGAEGIWQHALIDYAQAHSIGWLSWAFNPNSADTGGLLADDWLTVVQSKADLYQGHLAPPLDVGSTGVFGQAQTRLSVQGRSTSTTAQTSNIGFVLQIVNDGPSPVDFGQLELRYWFKPGTSIATQQVNIDYAAVGAANISGRFDPPDASGVGALSLTFAPNAGSISPYTSSGDIDVRIHRLDWTPYDQIVNFSFRPESTLVEWDHVGLYRAGVLVWGTPPAGL
ncbi:MAG: cellulase family glycosylhydrolase [Chloroflexi bacterium]|nr:cellulase family glycosylhydrolase [Chloroflexota bacterium]